MHKIISNSPTTLVVSKVRDLNKDLPGEDIQIPNSFDSLFRKSTLNRNGLGALMAWDRNMWFLLRGFDERIKIWGGPDTDLLKRASRMFVPITELNVLKDNRDLNIYHQWHHNSSEKYEMILGPVGYRKMIGNNLAVVNNDTTNLRNEPDWGLSYIDS